MNTMLKECQQYGRLLETTMPDLKEAVPGL